MTIHKLLRIGTHARGLIVVVLALATLAGSHLHIVQTFGANWN